MGMNSRHGAGSVLPEELHRIVVVSPHFDDAAMGAGQLLIRHAGRSATTVITVLGGRPPAYPDEPTRVGRPRRVPAGDDVVAVRREEDRAAMDVLGAEPVWLEFADHQYLARRTAPRPPTWPPPSRTRSSPPIADRGVHPDGHRQPRPRDDPRRALLVRDRHPDWAWFAYEDHGYKHLPGHAGVAGGEAVPRRDLADAGHRAVDLDADRKRKAIWCYTSQIPPLEQDHALDERLAANVPEQFWRMAPPPRAMERLSEWYE